MLSPLVGRTSEDPSLNPDYSCPLIFSHVLLLPMSHLIISFFSYGLLSHASFEQFSKVPLKTVRHPKTKKKTEHLFFHRTGPFFSTFQDYMKALGVTYHFLSKPLIEMAKCHLDPKKPSICHSVCRSHPRVVWVGETFTDVFFGRIFVGDIKCRVITKVEKMIKNGRTHL